MPKKELKVKMSGALNDVISHLESIIASLKEGTVVIQKGNSFISLKPKDQVALEIEAEQKKGKEELSIELSWKSEEVIAADDTTSSLVISSKEPEVPADETPEETTTESSDTSF